MSSHPTTQRQYATQVALTTSLALAIRQLWVALNPAATPEAMAKFGRALRAVVPQFGRAAAQQALANYELARLDARIVGTPPKLELPSMPEAKIEAGLEWAAASAQLDADRAKIEATILQRVEAAMAKAVLDEARDSTIAAVEGDAEALGFRRVPRPGACAWCLALATRRSTRGSGGDEHWGVYKTRATAGQLPAGTKGINRFHNGCHCVVEPVFSTDFEVPAWLRDNAKLYEDSADFNEFRRIVDARRRGEDVSPSPLAEPIQLPTVPPRQATAIAALLDSIDAAMRAA